MGTRTDACQSFTVTYGNVNEKWPHLGDRQRAN
jgi:hypothetical protein